MAEVDYTCAAIVRLSRDEDIGLSSFPLSPDPALGVIVGMMMMMIFSKF